MISPGRFSNVHHLTLHFSKGASGTGALRLFYLAVHGVVTQVSGFLSASLDPDHLVCS